jgi:DNA repair exonuclease SbcCD ATPase subunit
MQLNTLSVRNIKGIKWVDIDFQSLGHAIVIAGKNGAGKSSLIDAIQYLFAGGRAIPDDVIRHGEQEATINATLEDGSTIEKTFTPTGVRIMVKDPQGIPLTSPQTILNKLILSENKIPLLFDPNQFASLPAKDMLEMLKTTLGIDTNEQDTAYQEFYDKRGEANRDLKKAQHARESLNPPTNIPSYNMEELLNERKRRETNAVIIRQRQDKLQACRDRIAELKEELQQQEAKEREIIETPLPIREPVEEIDNLIKEAETAATARAVIEQATKLDQEISALQQDIAGYENTMEKIKEAKKDALKKVETFPIPGLKITDTGITINDTLPENLSQGEKLRLGINAAIAMQPELKILLVRDASVLDEDSLQEVIHDAEKHNTTILLEVVGDAPQNTPSLYITNGQWKEQQAKSDEEAGRLSGALG